MVKEDDIRRMLDWSFQPSEIARKDGEDSDGIMEEQVRKLRAMHVSVNDTMRQTGKTMFEVYEITEGRDVAVKKMAQLHLKRGTGWPWDRKDGLEFDPDHPRPSTGNPEEDAAQGIVNLFYGLELDNPVRRHLDTFAVGERRRMLDIIVEIIRTAKKDSQSS